MKVDVRQIDGNWDLGFALDKHSISSTYLGENEWGHAQYDTVRSEAGESLFRLKYRSDYSQVQLLGDSLNTHIVNRFGFVSFVIPMPPSKQRSRQPVPEIARNLAALMGVPCLEDFLIKNGDTPQMKDIATRQEKLDILVRAFSVNDRLPPAVYNVLIVDDLYDSGSSLEAATTVLRACPKVQSIYVSTVTRRR